MDDNKKNKEDNNRISQKERHYMYIVECADGTYYTGYTTDLERRIGEHNRGDGAKYTRGRLPVKLIYHEEYTTQREAMQREYNIKQMTRGEKEALIG